MTENPTEQDLTSAFLRIITEKKLDTVQELKRAPFNTAVVTRYLGFGNKV